MRNEERAGRTRAAILEAAGRSFRTDGFGGAGIDGLTRAAGVSNGAFYGHFKTKADAFAAAVAAGLRDLAAGIAATREAHGPDWLPAFVEFYLGDRRICALGEACALPTLSADVARADAGTREVYAAEFAGVIAEMAAGLDGDEGTAIALLALLSGAATLARALPDPAAGARVAAVVRDQALAMAERAMAGRAMAGRAAAGRAAAGTPFAKPGNRAISPR